MFFTTTCPFRINQVRSVLVGACLKRISELAQEFVEDTEFDLNKQDGTLMQDERIALKALLQLIWNWRQHFEDEFLFSSNLFEESYPETYNIAGKEQKGFVNYNRIVFVTAIVDILELAVRHFTATRLRDSNRVRKIQNLICKGETVLAIYGKCNFLS